MHRINIIIKEEKKAAEYYKINADLIKLEARNKYKNLSERGEE